MKLRFGKLLIVPVIAMAMAGGTYAVGTLGSSGPKVDDADVVASTSPSASPDAVERFHGDTTTCPMPPGTTLDGNWTHGDYVSAWAKTDDHVKTLAAAKSDCGKPASAVEPKHSKTSEAKNKDAKDDNESDVGAEHENEHADADHGKPDDVPPAHAQNDDHGDHGETGHHGGSDDGEND